jgi:hypothetical protein
MGGSCRGQSLGPRMLAITALVLTLTGVLVVAHGRDLELPEFFVVSVSPPHPAPALNDSINRPDHQVPRH